MTHQLAISPVRRTNKESFSTTKDMVSPLDSGRPEKKRTVRFEHSDFNDQQDDVITCLKVLVNGETFELTPQKNVLDLMAEDIVEVTEIGFTSNESTGVYAAEGYVSKVGDLTASLIDYNDGRFSGSARAFPANGGAGVVAGLNNQWTVQFGWNGMTINLMHYTERSTDVAGRFIVELHVGQPDYEFEPNI